MARVTDTDMKRDTAHDMVTVLRERIVALESMIDAFVAGHRWACDAWKAEPHIAPLFVDATKRARSRKGRSKRG